MGGSFLSNFLCRFSTLNQDLGGSEDQAFAKNVKQKPIFHRNRFGCYLGVDLEWVSEPVGAVPLIVAPLKAALKVNEFPERNLILHSEMGTLIFSLRLP